MYPAMAPRIFCISSSYLAVSSAHSRVSILSFMAIVAASGLLIYCQWLWLLRWSTTCPTLTFSSNVSSKAALSLLACCRDFSTSGSKRGSFISCALYTSSQISTSLSVRPILLNPTVSFSPQARDEEHAAFTNVFRRMLSGIR
jgi:hypothetical protein